MATILRRIGVIPKSLSLHELRFASTQIHRTAVIDEMRTAHEVLTKTEIRAFCHRIGFVFRDQNILNEALLHHSKEPEDIHNNARLESYGSRILSLLATEHTFAHYPNLPPRALSDIVQSLTKTSTLATIANNMGLKRVVQYSQKEGKTPQENGQADALADSLQALIAAIYIDQGPSAAKSFVNRYVLSRTDLDFKKFLDQDRPKVQLYEHLKRNGEAKPEYKLLDESGRYTHEPVFAVGLYVDGRLLSKGVGQSIKKAEEDAARKYIVDFLLQSATPSSLPSDKL
eukprot:TRINITY_DN7499_c0_g1_i2.p1 TRINITY_DN7499_c0_g1~~TRINITY_DN7499_c0_g1_i2.p1  ORF type:complete len:286 (+),score=64.17 TRINITY_DN7499_c0_g1_i2:74-931(+)